MRIQVKKRAGADVSGEGTGCAKALGSSGDLGAWVTGGADFRASEGHGRSRVEAETPPCHFAPAVPEISLGITWAGDLAPQGVEAIAL